MKNYLDKLPEKIITLIKDYTPRDKDMKAPTAAHIKSLLDDYEDDPRFGTFYEFSLCMNRYEKEEKEEREQRERERRYNSDSDFSDIPYNNNSVSDTESDSD